MEKLLDINEKLLIDFTGEFDNAKVKLLPKRYSLSDINPAMGSVYECSGRLSLTRPDPVYKYGVSWSNGAKNFYVIEDLVVVMEHVKENRCISIWKASLHRIKR